MIRSLFQFLISSQNSFDGEEKGERVLFLLRRHPFVIFIQLFFFILLSLVPVLVVYFFSDFLLTQLPLALAFFIGSVWYLLLWTMIFYSLTMYTLDYWIVTDRRIIDSTQHGFFDRTVSELHLHRIQDISAQTKGIIPTVLHYGDLYIQTAGTEEKFHFSQIPRPNKTKERIMRQVSQALKKTQ